MGCFQNAIPSLPGTRPRRGRSASFRLSRICILGCYHSIRSSLLGAHRAGNDQIPSTLIATTSARHYWALTGQGTIRHLKPRSRPLRLLDISFRTAIPATNSFISWLLSRRHSTRWKAVARQEPQRWTYHDTCISLSDQTAAGPRRLRRRDDRASQARIPIQASRVPQSRLGATGR